MPTSSKDVFITTGAGSLSITSMDQTTDKDISISGSFDNTYTTITGSGGLSWSNSTDILSLDVLLNEEDIIESEFDSQFVGVISAVETVSFDLKTGLRILEINKPIRFGTRVSGEPVRFYTRPGAIPVVFWSVSGIDVIIDKESNYINSLDDQEYSKNEKQVLAITSASEITMDITSDKESAITAEIHTGAAVWW
jgi:hypothetical protein